MDQLIRIDKMLHWHFVFLVTFLILCVIGLVSIYIDFRKDKSKGKWIPLFCAITATFLLTVGVYLQFGLYLNNKTTIKRFRSDRIVQGSDGVSRCESGKILKVYIHENLPKEYWPAVRWAIEEWNSSLGIEVLQFAGYAYGGDDWEDFGEKNAVLVTWKPGEWRRNGSYSMGHAQSYVSLAKTGEFGWKSIIAMNSYCQFFTGDQEIDQRLFDFDSILLHEFGHSIGIKGHLGDSQKKNPSNLVMFRSLSLGEKTRVLQKADLDAFSCKLE